VTGKKLDPLACDCHPPAEKLWQQAILARLLDRAGPEINVMRKDRHLAK
jgi:hypothetical protein